MPINKASTVFSEKLSAIAEVEIAIVPRFHGNDPMNRPSLKPLKDYIIRLMRENDLTFTQIEYLARKRGGKLGKSTVQGLVGDNPPDNPGFYTLVEIAWGLGRPIEEIIGAALGEPVVESSSYQRSEFANLYDLYRQLPNGEQKAMKRYLQMMEREMRSTLKQQSEPFHADK